MSMDSGAASSRPEGPSADRPLDATSGSDLQPALDAPPNAYRGVLPMPGAPMSLGNTRIFDDTHGVTWNPAAGELLFSVVQINNIWRWRESVTTNMGFDIVRRSGLDAQDLFGFRGLAATADGALIVAESRSHRVTKSSMGYDKPVTLADRWSGGDGTPAGRFNTPTDVVVRRDGNIYFSDPVSGSATPELNFSGVYRIDPAGNVSLPIRDLKEPWGLALSAEHDALFVSTGDARNGRGTGILRFTINPDGSLGARRVFADGAAAGTPGGLCTDQAGNVYHTNLTVRIFTPDGARLNTTINIPGAKDCAFGDPDLKSLFFTAGSSPAVYNLWRVRMNIPGVR